MILYVGLPYSERVITVIPGYCSSDPEEPCQFMNPGLYIFDFNIDTLQPVDDWLNGRNNVAKYRSIKPGVIGKEGTLEVIINIPVKMRLATVEEFESIVERLSYHTQNYVIDTLLANIDAYGFTRDGILALGQL